MRLKRRSRRPDQRRLFLRKRITLFLLIYSFHFIIILFPILIGSFVPAFRNQPIRRLSIGETFFLGFLVPTICPRTKISSEWPRGQSICPQSVCQKFSKDTENFHIENKVFQNIKNAFFKINRLYFVVARTHQQHPDRNDDITTPRSAHTLIDTKHGSVGDEPSTG